MFFDVYIGRRYHDTVFFSYNISLADAKESLINDGYLPAITVKRSPA